MPPASAVDALSHFHAATAHEFVLADLRDRDTWHAHLSLASHDLAGRPELLHDVEVFVRDLHEPYPSEFEATRLGIFRLHHADWAGPWWTTFTWEFVTSIKLGADRSKK